MVVQWLRNKTGHVKCFFPRKERRRNVECLLWDKKRIVLSLTLFIYKYTALYCMEKKKKYSDYYDSVREAR